jgi:hypothetical protein
MFASPRAMDTWHGRALSGSASGLADFPKTRCHLEEIIHELVRIRFESDLMRTA